MTFWKWSRTAASNGNADSSINYAEGMAPSGLNDSGRAVMAAAAKYRDDTSGAIATGGTSTAYTVSSYQVFDTLAHLDGNVIAFTPHTTNGATVTLNVDGLGAKPLRPAPSVELQSGVLVQGTPYAALYNNSDQVFYLFGVGTAPAVPLGSSFDYWGTTAPSSYFVLAYGQAISRTTYATLFSILSTTYGSGDGSTTFNIPDLRGRVVAGKDDMGGSAASRLTSSFLASPTTLGGTGGSESRQLATENLPPYTPTVASATVSVTSTSSIIQVNDGGVDSANLPGGASDYPRRRNSSVTSTGTASITMNAQGGTSSAFGIVQPTIIANKLLRII